MTEIFPVVRRCLECAARAVGLWDIALRVRDSSDSEEVDGERKETIEKGGTGPISVSEQRQEPFLLLLVVVVVVVLLLL